MAPVSFVIACGSSSICRSCLQYLLSVAPAVAPVPVVRGSGIICRSCGFSAGSCCSWLQYLSLLAPVFGCRCSCGYSGCRCCLWLQYLSFADPVSSICRSRLVAPPVVAVAPVVAPVSSPVVRVSSTTICRLWLHWLSLVAPVAPVARLWLRLRYLLSFAHGSRNSCRLWLLPVVMAPVAPVSVVGVSSTTICRLWLL